MRGGLAREARRRHPLAARSRVRGDERWGWTGSGSEAGLSPQSAGSVEGAEGSRGGRRMATISGHPGSVMRVHVSKPCRA